MQSFKEYLREQNSCAVITVAHMKEFETLVDKIFKRFGLDFRFTKHFRERMSHERNNPCITIQELSRTMRKLYEKYKGGDKALSKFKDAEVVLKDLQTSLNIPMAVEYDRKNDELDVVMKTIMRKKDFKSPDPVLKVK